MQNSAELAAPREGLNAAEVTALRRQLRESCMGVPEEYAPALLIDLVTRVKAEYSAPLKVIATGGVASLFEGASETIDHFDQSLMEVGLLEVYRRNQKD